MFLWVCCYSTVIWSSWSEEGSALVGRVQVYSRLRGGAAEAQLPAQGLQLPPPPVWPDVGPLLGPMFCWQVRNARSKYHGGSLYPYPSPYVPIFIFVIHTGYIPTRFSAFYSSHYRFATIFHPWHFNLLLSILLPFLFLPFFFPFFNFCLPFLHRLPPIGDGR